MFLFFMATLRQQRGKQPGQPLQPKDFSPTHVQKALQTTIHTLDKVSVDMPAPESARKSIGLETVTPGLTCALSVNDGQNTTVYSVQKRRSLFKTWLQPPTSPKITLLIASEKIHPQGRTLPWQPMKEDELLTIQQTPRHMRVEETTLNDVAIGKAPLNVWTIKA
jgi:hypothetical protein